MDWTGASIPAAAQKHGTCRSPLGNLVHVQPHLDSILEHPRLPRLFLRRATSTGKHQFDANARTCQLTNHVTGWLPITLQRGPRGVDRYSRSRINSVSSGRRLRVAKMSVHQREARNYCWRRPGSCCAVQPYHPRPRKKMQLAALRFASRPQSCLIVVWNRRAQQIPRIFLKVIHASKSPM